MQRSAGGVIAVLVASFALSQACRLEDAPESPAVRSGTAQSRAAAILRVPDARQRAQALLAFFEELDPQDAPGVGAAFEAARRNADELALVLFASWWVEHDPQGAFDQPAAQLWGGSSVWLKAVVREWARLDPAAARRAVQAMPEAVDSLQAEVVRPLIRGLFESGADPGELIPFIEALPLAGRWTRNKALDTLAAEVLARDGVDASLRFAAAFPDGRGKFKLQFYRRLATELTLVDPQRAAEWAERQAGGPYGDNLLRRVGSKWGWLDGELAMAWAVALPAGQERDDTVLDAYRGWMQRDAGAASAWLRRQEPTPALEPAFASFIVQVASEDPEQALDWLDKIPIDDEARLRRIRLAIALRWLAADRVAANAWVEQQDAETIAALHASERERKQRQQRLQRRPVANEPAGEGPGDS
jgi:hypothetical protein